MGGNLNKLIKLVSIFTFTLFSYANAEVKMGVEGGLGYETSKIFGIIGVVLASVNIFGGFIVTYRMLSMFKKKPKKQTKA